MEAVERVGNSLTPVDTLYIVLVGHGSSVGGKSFFLVQFNVAEVTVKISRSELEEALKSCQARVIVTSTACYAGGFKSPLWTLFCAAEENQKSEAATESGTTETVRPPFEGAKAVYGGAFTVCLFAALLKEYGITFPLPGRTPYPLPHSNHNIGSSHHPSRSNRTTLKQFLRRMEKAKLRLPPGTARRKYRDDILPLMEVTPELFEVKGMRNILKNWDTCAYESLFARWCAHVD